MTKSLLPKDKAHLSDDVDKLIDAYGGGHHRDIVRDVIENALRMLDDVSDRGDSRVMQTAIRELRYSYKLFAPYADTRKATIFGSARMDESKVEYQQAVEFARKISDKGWMVITGAGPGIMQAGHEGAGSEKSFGANIRLPWEQTANPVIAEDAKLITFKYFFTRKLTFLRHAHAIVLFPGGFGTMDEGFETLTLMQTGKSQLMPLVLVDRPGGTYWKTWDRHVKDHLLRNELISPDDLNLYQITDDPDQAVRWVLRFYRNFHSLRYVRDLLVIRLKNRPTDSAIEALNEDFEDIIEGEPIQAIDPTPDEREDNDNVHLARVALGFDRKSYGRLREFIDALNRH